MYKQPAVHKCQHEDMSKYSYDVGNYPLLDITHNHFSGIVNYMQLFFLFTIAICLFMIIRAKA